MPMMLNTRSCEACGAVTAIRLSEDDGLSWAGPNNDQQHFDWHRRETEGKPRPGTYAAACDNGHVSYPDLGESAPPDRGWRVLHTDISCGTCPECGADRKVPAGDYVLGSGGAGYKRRPFTHVVPC